MIKLSAAEKELHRLFLEGSGKTLLFLSNYSPENSHEGAEECLRLVHALGLTARFLGYGEIAERAQGAENLLARSLPVSGGPGEAGAGELSSVLEELTGAVSEALADIRAWLEAEGGEAEDEDAAGDGGSSSTEFEAALLTEAQTRGEKFYRVEAEISGDEPMPFPRLYLLVNNLELAGTLIRLEPPLEVLQKKENLFLRVYASSNRDPESLKKLLDTTGLEKLDIEEIPLGGEENWP
ncbi:MAG: hypothetical protein LBC67_01235 [Spirochaetales bacterium]|nr:hypothetical protein [Spirochaetales bacterium]